jgi:Flp pilus assembly pilin Flp
MRDMSVRTSRTRAYWGRENKRMRVVEWSWLKATQVSVWWNGRRTGQSTVEYALVGALVVIVSAGAMTLLGSEISNVFKNITTTLAGTH